MKSFLTAVLLIFFFTGFTQADSKKILETLSSFKDQYGKGFSNSLVKDSLVIIYICGLEDPLTMAYDKLKNKNIRLTQQVVFVGAFNNMHGEAAAKITHLKEGFVSRYGKDYVSILLDTDGKLGKLIHAEGLAVIILKKEKNLPLIIDYGTKRKTFFYAINQYFNA